SPNTIADLRILLGSTLVMRKSGVRDENLAAAAREFDAAYDVAEAAGALQQKTTALVFRARAMLLQGNAPAELEEVIADLKKTSHEAGIDDGGELWVDMQLLIAHHQARQRGDVGLCAAIAF